MIRYRFKERPLCIQNAKRADAQKIGETLTAIKEQTKGRFNSKVVLDAARDKSNYLHRFFEWHDTIAADKYRQEQARELVGCIDIVETKKGKEQPPMPAFVSLIERNGRQYRTVGEVLDSAELQAIALRQAESDFEAYEKRLRQFADICTAIRAAREMIAERRAKYERKKKGGDEAAA